MNAPTQKVDLSLIPRDDLVTELKRRHDACIFAAVQESEKDGGSVYCVQKGSIFEVKGLIYYADMRIGGQLAAVIYHGHKGE